MNHWEHRMHGSKKILSATNAGRRLKSLVRDHHHGILDKLSFHHAATSGSGRPLPSGEAPSRGSSASRARSAGSNGSGRPESKQAPENLGP